jgi:hypothetical protein
MVRVRKRTIPTEWRPLVGEVSAKFADRGCHVVSVTDPYGRTQQTNKQTNKLHTQINIIYTHAFYMTHRHFLASHVIDSFTTLIREPGDYLNVSWNLIYETWTFRRLKKALFSHQSKKVKKYWK